MRIYRLCNYRRVDLQRLKPWMYALLLILFVSSHTFGFGKNKVHYEQLDWQSTKGSYYHIYSHQNSGELSSHAHRYLAGAYATYASTFRYSHRTPVPVIVYGSPNLFEQTNVISQVIPEGVGGFTEVFKNRVVVPWTGSHSEFRHVLRHELVHAFEFGILYDRLGGAFLRNGGLQLPLWFAEGLAEMLSSGWNAEADMFMMDRVVHGDIPSPGPELSGYLAYKGGQSFLLFLHQAYGDSLFTRFMRLFRETRNVDDAFKQTYGEGNEEIADQWKQQLRRQYWPEIAVRRDPTSTGVKIGGKRFSRAVFNLRPRVSPDGSKIAFFSDRKDYTGIYVVDSSGRTVATMSQQGYGGYFESFHPFRSGMCWSPDSRQLAFVTKKSGKDQIRIVDIETKKLIRVLTFPSLTTLSSPDWSRDGERIVFTAVREHEADLYMYAMTDSTLTRLTSGPAYESDPAFSPDGRSIVYAVEDTIGLSQPPRWPHNPGPVFNLALLDLETMETRQITSSAWNERSPRFAGVDSIVFISDRNGIDNVYRGSLDSALSAVPLTDVIGGCSNPDWSAGNSVLVYSLFQKGKWSIYRMDRADTVRLGDTLVPTRWAQHLGDTSVSFIPKLNRPVVPHRSQRNVSRKAGSRRGKVSETGTIRAIDSVAGDTTLPFSDTLSHERGVAVSALRKPDSLSLDSVLQRVIVRETSQRYRLKFSPDIVAVGLGASSLYGVFGQAFVSLSDLMGDHRITVAGDLAGNILENAYLYGGYQNSKFRLSFGAGVFYGRQTWESRFLLLDSAGSSARPITATYTLIESGGEAGATYPFSLRSRLSFQCIYNHVERIVEDSSRAVTTYDILLPSLAYTYDNILWGLTGPSNGTRARIGVTFIPPAPTFDAAFVSCEVDYRRYFHIARRFVFAARVSAGISENLDPEKATRRYLLGGTDFWLNYAWDESQRAANREDLSYSQLVVPFRGWYYFEIDGSRYAVMNVEFRFPFIKEINIVWPLPIRLRYINGALFADLGNAWDPEEQMRNLPLPEKIYGGFGFGLRANLGIFVLRYDRAWRTDWRRFVDRPVNYWSLGAEY